MKTQHTKAMKETKLKILATSNILFCWFSTMKNLAATYRA